MKCPVAHPVPAGEAASEEDVVAALEVGHGPAQREEEPARDLVRAVQLVERLGAAPPAVRLAGCGE
jgi:hypothetical protein